MILHDISLPQPVLPSPMYAGKPSMVWLPIHLENNWGSSDIDSNENGDGDGDIISNVMTDGR